MSRSSVIDKYREQLFDDSDNVKMTPNEKEQLMRYRMIFTKRLDTPSISNKELVEMIASECNVSSSQAYRDIANTEHIFGSIINADKEWTRYLVVESLKEALNLARAKGDVKEMIKAASALGVVSRLDKEDPEKLPYEDIVPAPIEFANDPSILGITCVENPREYVDKIKRKYIEDIEFEEVARGK